MVPHRRRSVLCAIVNLRQEAEELQRAARSNAVNGKYRADCKVVGGSKLLAKEQMAHRLWTVFEGNRYVTRRTGLMGLALRTRM
jgi:hypothetical protein